MPTYDYQCQKCGHEFERVQRITEDPIKTCPECKSKKAKRLLSAPNFILKGGGWYADGYGNSNSGGTSSSSSDGDNTGGDSSSSSSSSEGDSGGDSSSSSGGSSKSDSDSKSSGKSSSKSNILVEGGVDGQGHSLCFAT